MTAQEVDAWLDTVSDPAQRAALQELREVILDVVPEGEEAISYGVPAVKYRGRPLVSYTAAKAHCSFFVQSPEVMAQFAEELTGYRTAAGTIRFQPSAPLPADLVTRLVRARMAETDGTAPRKPRA